MKISFQKYISQKEVSITPLRKVFNMLVLLTNAGHAFNSSSWQAETPAELGCMRASNEITGGDAFYERRDPASSQLEREWDPGGANTKCQRSLCFKVY